MARKIDSLTISCLILVCFVVMTFKINATKESTFRETKKPKLPAQLGGWNLRRELPISDDILAILGTKGAVIGEYVNEKQGKILVYILRSSSRRTSIHQPEYCYIGSGKNELLQKGTVDIQLNTGKSIAVNYLFIQTGRGFQVVTYFYTANELVSNSYNKQQFYFLLKRLKNEPVEGSLVRISKFYRKGKFEEELESLQPIVKSLLMNREF